MGNTIRFHRGGLCLTGESDRDDHSVHDEGEKPDGIAFRAFASRTSQRDVDTFGKLPDGPSLHTGNASYREGNVIEAHSFG